MIVSISVKPSDVIRDGMDGNGIYREILIRINHMPGNSSDHVAWLQSRPVNTPDEWDGAGGDAVKRLVVGGAGGLALR